MIIYNNIGNNGRLGNQLFQTAATIGIANKNNTEPMFPLNQTYKVPKLFNLNLKYLNNTTLNLPTINENSFSFNETFFNIGDNKNINGYFQSEKYFKHVENDIRTLFSFKSDVMERNKQILPLNTVTTSIHLRLGDYRQYPNHHPICNIKYYREAIDIINSDVYIIFSDEPDSANAFFNFIKNKIIINTKNEEDDLFLMSNCANNIIANSSFSWWGAWLNKYKDKQIIAPKKWFGDAYSKHDTKDLYCDNWIIV